jgi:hypothetical protein
LTSDRVHSLDILIRKGRLARALARRQDAAPRPFSAPLAPSASKLSYAHTRATVARKLRSRTPREELVAKNILRTQAPAVAAQTVKLHSARVRDAVQKKISRRPDRSELIEKRVVHQLFEDRLATMPIEAMREALSRLAARGPEVQAIVLDEIRAVSREPTLGATPHALLQSAVASLDRKMQDRPTRAELVRNGVIRSGRGNVHNVSIAKRSLQRAITKRPTADELRAANILPAEAAPGVMPKSSVRRRVSLLIEQQLASRPSAK